MIGTFTASNGRVVEFNASRFLVIDQANSLQRYTFSPKQAVALREFFQAERDQELGRWRDPDFRSMVCYPEKGSVRVLDELTGESESWTRRQSSQDINRAVSGFYTASRYFAAPPVPKPWHYAKSDELWALRLANTENELIYRWDSTEEWWFSSNSNDALHRMDDRAIVAGRRIWPEVVPGE